MLETIERLRNKFRKLKEACENNHGKINVMVIDVTTKDVFPKMLV